MQESDRREIEQAERLEREILKLETIMFACKLGGILACVLTAFSAFMYAVSITG